jgi:ADP-ribose pyrophosphatase YjhB (NUDIX family)
MELLFVKDIPVRITKDVTVLDAKDQYDYLLEAGFNELQLAQAVGNLLVKTTQTEFDQLLAYMQQQEFPKLKGITVLVDEYQSIQEFFQQRFKLIKAAGGIVSKGDEILMIYRLGKWDLPKGKRYKGEKSDVAALREVEEECNVKVKLLTKLCTTWHTYLPTADKERGHLKKTTWYAMSCLDDTHMLPQVEEGIEQVAWMSEEAVRDALKNSYQSIRYVFQAYRKYRTHTMQTNSMMLDGIDAH